MDIALVEWKYSVKESVVRCLWSFESKDDFDFIIYRMKKYKMQIQIFLISPRTTHN